MAFALSNRRANILSNSNFSLFSFSKMCFQNKRNLSKHIVNSTETSKFIWKMMQTKRNIKSREFDEWKESFWKGITLSMNRFEFVCSSHFEHTGRDTPAKVELEWKNATNSLDFHYSSDFISFCWCFRPRTECIDFAAALRSKYTRRKVFYF